MTALSLPPNVSADTSWIVRFGEGPPYALVAGKPRADGARPKPWSGQGMDEFPLLRAAAG